MREWWLISAGKLKVRNENLHHDLIQYLARGLTFVGFETSFSIEVKNHDYGI